MGSCFPKPIDVPEIKTNVEGNSCPSDCCECNNLTCCVFAQKKKHRTKKSSNER